MKYSRTFFARVTVTAAVGLLALGAPVAATAATTDIATTTGTTTIAGVPASVRGALSECSANYFGGDSRLGPAHLPLLGPVGFELFGYRRTGPLSPQRFLAQYYSATANGGVGGWIYPPDNGFVVEPDGQPVEWTATLPVGQRIDRYGSEFGMFLAPAGAPYASRSIPPQSLDGNPAAGCNYHQYQVLKPFAVHAGPIAPWFGQPGEGLQYQVDGTLVSGAPAAVNVIWLIDNGYLMRLI
ncbi:MAG: TNT domain-containing protein [Actinocrinis sp.]